MAGLENEMQAMTFDPSLKKKKKASSAVVKSSAPEDAPAAAPAPEVRPGEADVEADAAPQFDPTKKKKKVGIVAPPTAIISADGVVTVEQASSRVQPGISTEGQRDYTYEELLNRAFEIMRQKNPDMISGEKKRFIMKPPSVMRAGTKKTSFANFAEICRLLKRQPKHVLAFILAELGTEGSVDSNECLIIKGKFQQAHIETVLRKYIKEYVTCHTCRAPETHLQKEDRLYFLQCEVCQSRCSVAGIKTGFHAQVGKRAAQRAKTVS